MFLALREIRRSLVRYALLVVAIGLLVFLILFQQALQDGLVTAFIGGIRNQSAPVLVYSVDGQRNLQGSVITPPLEEQIRSAEGVGRAAVVSQGTFTVRVAGAEPTDAAVVGTDDVWVKLAKCCTPVPGDPIMGFVTPDTLADYITDDIDCVVDCIDSVASKVALIAWCRRRRIPIVTAGGAGGQIDPTHIKVADLSKTTNDPLAAKARSLLRRNHNFPRADSKRSFGVPCVYSTEQLRYPSSEGGVCRQKTFNGETVKLDCEGGIGAVSMVTGAFGLNVSAKIVERLLRGIKLDV